MIRKTPVLLLLVLAATLLLNGSLPLSVKECLYALSVTLKSLLVAALPFLVFALLFKAASSLAQHATRILLSILAVVCCSNLVTTCFGTFVGSVIYRLDFSLLPPTSHGELQAAWDFSIPKLLSNDVAMVAGIVLGILSTKLDTPRFTWIQQKLEQGATVLLRGITAILPLFVAGFFVKLISDGKLAMVIREYTLIFSLVALVQVLYLLLAYAILSRFRWSRLSASLHAMFPAALAGFGTMSSAAAMPLTVVGAEVNTTHKEIVRAVIPTTVNIHLLGDCIAIPMFAYAVLKNYGMPTPTLLMVALFALHFVIAKFSVAAVPGGGILVMLPILESYLGFTAPQLSLITALYLLFDPVITCANVLGNGAFAKLFDQLVSLWHKAPTQDELHG